MICLVFTLGLLLLGPGVSVAIPYPSDSDAAAMITYLIDAKTADPHQSPVHQIWLKRISSDSASWDNVWKTSFFSKLSDSVSCFPIPDTGIAHLLGLHDSSTFCPPNIIRSFTLSDRAVSWEPGDSTEMISMELIDRRETDEDRFMYFVIPDNGSFTIPQDIHERAITWVEPQLQITRKRMHTIETTLGTTVVEGVSLANLHLRDTP
jgi:hypothetical protein